MAQEVALYEEEIRCCCRWPTVGQTFLLNSKLKSLKNWITVLVLGSRTVKQFDGSELKFIRDETNGNKPVIIGLKPIL